MAGRKYGTSSTDTVAAKMIRVDDISTRRHHTATIRASTRNPVTRIPVIRMADDVTDVPRYWYTLGAFKVSRSKVPVWDT
nr:hypothetical protein [Kutzneria chonburiensis]